MRPVRGSIRVYVREVGPVVGMSGEPPILFLEDAGVVALDGIPVGVGTAVAIHRVDEEQAEHLDPLRAQALLLVAMLADGAADHFALHGQRFHVAVCFAFPQEPFVAGHAKFDELVARLDPNLADAARAIHRALRHRFEIVAVLDRHRLAPHAALRFDVQFDFCTDDAAPAAGGKHADVRGVVGVLDRGRRDLDLLHQLALVRVDRVQPIDHVVRLHVRRRVAQRTQRRHGRQGFLAAAAQAAVHALRLVHDQDGPRGADQVDRFFAAGLLAVLVQVVDVLLVDGADRHHHDLDVRAGGEVAHLPELGGVVQEILEGRARIERAKMLLGQLERLVHALLDGDRRHDDDEFGEAVAFVQFQDGPQIDVRLARSRLHFHGEVAGIQRRGGRQAVAQLDGVQVVENRVVGQGQAVARAEVVFGQGESRLALRGVRRDGELGTADLLAAEQVANGADGL